MPLMVELKYEYFINTWPGRVKLAELAECIALYTAASHTMHSQNFQPKDSKSNGTTFFSLYYLCLAEPLNKFTVNWFMAEFWFTAGTTFFYFTAFLAQLVDFGPYEDEEWQYWIDAQIAAGVFGLFNDVFYAIGSYLLYLDWQANPTGEMAAPAPPPA